MKKYGVPIANALAYGFAAISAMVLAAWMAGSFTPRAKSQSPAVSAAPSPTIEASPVAQASPTTTESSPAAQAEASPASLDPNDMPSSLTARIPDLLVGIIEDFNYMPQGKRDPFQPIESLRFSGDLLGPTFPLQKFDLDQLRLIGIIWNVRMPKAMILDPAGKGYIVKLKERIGRNNGYIARIREGEIVVVESIMDTDGRFKYTSKIIKLATQAAQ